jgi:hypothetical protein
VKKGIHQCTLIQFWYSTTMVSLGLQEVESQRVLPRKKESSYARKRMAGLPGLDFSFVICNDELSSPEVQRELVCLHL